MTVISVKGGSSQAILDGSQETLSLLSITTGTGLIHVGDPAPEGFDVPFAGGDKIVLPANLSATLRADGFVVTGSIGQWGGQVYSGGGGELLPTQAIIDDGQTITATGGQTISVAVADNVPSLTVKNWAFWDPFTVTVGTDGEDFYGYLVDDPFSFGSISNQPVNGFTLMQAVNVGGSVDIRLHGPHPIVGELVGALVGISNEDYSIGEMSVTQSNNPETGLWINKLIIHGVPAWTTSQQVPIVIIPQNGG